MTTDASADQSARRGCPYCGERMSVGFGDLLPTKRREGPARVQCSSCRGWARVASSSQVVAVIGLVLGLAGGAILGARASIDSDQSTIIVLALSVAGGFLFSYVAGYALLRLTPDGEPPSRVTQRDRRGKRSGRHKK
jgi:hypothetical protein